MSPTITKSAAAGCVAAGCAALPTEAQLIGALVGAVIGLWSSAAQTYPGRAGVVLWLVLLIGHVLSSIMFGVTGSIVLQQIGPAYPVSAPVAGLPEWLTAGVLAASSQILLPLLVRLVRVRAGDQP